MEGLASGAKPLPSETNERLNEPTNTLLCSDGGSASTAIIVWPLRNGTGWTLLYLVLKAEELFESIESSTLCGDLEGK